MITALSWSGLPRSVGGGFGACIEWPKDIEIPNIAGSLFELDGKDHKVLRVVRLYRDPKGRKPASRIAIVTSDDGGEKLA